MSKLKLTFYVDTYPGMETGNIGVYATTMPGQKGVRFKRYAFDVHIPDPNEPDGHIPVENMREVDKE